MATAIELIVTDFRGKLDGQLAALESARTRASVALATSGVVAGLVLPNKLGHRPGIWFGLGVASLFFTALCTLEIMRPRKLILWPEGDGRLDWSREYQAYIEEHPQEDRSGEILIPQMADDMAGWYRSNKGRLTWIQRTLTAAFVGVALQFGFWGVALFH
jgi:hypothetical protein